MREIVRIYPRGHRQSIAVRRISDLENGKNQLPFFIFSNDDPGSKFHTIIAQYNPNEHLVPPESQQKSRGKFEQQCSSSMPPYL